MSAPGAAVAVAERVTRLGFIGLGWIGRKRLEVLAGSTAVEIAALADTDPGRLAAAREIHPRAFATRDVAELLDGGLDGVVIATPNGCHEEQVLHALARGMAVFCQKPLGISAEGTAHMVDAARRADRLLATDYCYRHVQGMGELRRRILDGALGEILSIDLSFHNAYGPDKQWCGDPALAGGGCMLDLGIHLIDLALWLQDFPAMEVTASRLYSEGLPLARRPALEDLAYAEIRQENGAILRLASSWHAQAGCDAIIEARIMGTRGGGLWRNVNGSFYDFEVYACHGAAAEKLGGYPDAWDARAISAWAERLASGPGFDPAALEIVQGARLVDAIYARADA